LSFIDEDQSGGLATLQTELHTLLAAGNDVNNKREDTHALNDVVAGFDPLNEVNIQTSKFDELRNVPLC
jgi:hypothetical protein